MQLIVPCNSIFDCDQRDYLFVIYFFPKTKNNHNALDTMYGIDHTKDANESASVGSGFIYEACNDTY